MTRFVELVGGPCDGELLDVSLIEDLSEGVALPTPRCRYPGGRAMYDPLPGGRAMYDPLPGDTAARRWYWTGDMA